MGFPKIKIKRIKTIKSIIEIFMSNNFQTLPTKNNDSRHVTIYLAGIKWVKALINIGMLEISKIKPDNIKAGMNDMIMAN